ncbi:MAG: GNAT family N-acetyltransferase [Sedimentisphaerales bacterium]|nr:GNAT family N-acetyltransferase [Sedimentisphaerales bacterium]
MVRSETICLHDRWEIESFLRQNVYLYIYAIGDLDDFFWPYTTWYAWYENDEIRAIALLYGGRKLPTLLALSEESKTKQLLHDLVQLLPQKFHAHLRSGVNDVLKKKYDIKSHGQYGKMALKNKSSLLRVDCSEAFRLKNEDLDEILEFYEQVYPGNWFDSEMLRTKQYFGIRKENKLVSVAGIHVYSEQYKVAALGNIVTHPDYRGNGFGKAVTAKLCRELSKKVDHIGLNVKSDNDIAISMYEDLGFEIVDSYWEYTAELK